MLPSDPGLKLPFLPAGCRFCPARDRRHLPGVSPPRQSRDGEGGCTINAFSLLPPRCPHCCHPAALTAAIPLPSLLPLRTTRHNPDLSHIFHQVRGLMADGLMLSFLTFFHGTVDPFHLANPLAGSDWRRAYSEGQKLKVWIKGRKTSGGVCLREGV